IAITIGSSALDLAHAGQSGVLGWISQLSLTQTLRTFEQGLLPAGLLLGILAAIGGFAALAAVWLHPGVPFGTKCIRSFVCLAIATAIIRVCTQVRLSVALSEDRHNSFPPPRHRAAPRVPDPHLTSLHLSPTHRPL